MPSGFDDEGRIRGVEMTYAARCGFSADLSGPVTDRALFHADNCYYFENVLLRSLPLKTNTGLEHGVPRLRRPAGHGRGRAVIEEIAYALGKDPLEVRKLNLYGEAERDVTPYHQTVEDNVIRRDRRRARAERRLLGPARRRSASTMRAAR